MRRLTYFAPVITHRPYQNFSSFPTATAENVGFSLTLEDRAEFAVLAFKYLPNKDMFLPNAAQALCLWRWDGRGNRIDNITDWALKQFITRYAAETGTGKAAHPITREALFHYCYAVLHDPLYREKYAQNLKREFPRIPFYPGFWRWADWGAALMALHIGYEQVEPFDLERTDVPDERARDAGLSPKVLLRSLPDEGAILIDSETTLCGVPPEAWRYKLGNRSALDWVLDQHREKKPRDPTIRERFNTYRFADHKEAVIALLRRVTTVSVRTQAIVAELRAAPR